MSDLESRLQELIQIWMDAEQKAGGAVGLAFRACANALEKALADTKRQPSPEAVDDSDLALLEARRGGPTVPSVRVGLRREVEQSGGGVMAYRPNQDSSDYKAGYEEGFADALKPPPNYDKERAVIEAAREYIERCKNPVDWEHEDVAWLALDRAVEALNKAEDEP